MRLAGRLVGVIGDPAYSSGRSTLAKQLKTRLPGSSRTRAEYRMIPARKSSFFSGRMSILMTMKITTPP